MRLLVSLFVEKMWVVAFVFVLFGSACAEQPDQAPEEGVALHPIGFVQKEQGHDTLVLNEKFEPGLLGLDRFSHVWVIWWFDRNDTPKKRSVLQVFPRGDKKNPRTGVFASRSPVRPNLVGLTLCRILSVKGNVVAVDEIDAFANTPILDLKPYVPRSDSAKR